MAYLEQRAAGVKRLIVGLLNAQAEPDSRPIINTFRPHGRGGASCRRAGRHFLVWLKYFASGGDWFFLTGINILSAPRK
jgi:hypothetical protein